jgi:glutaconate CoA-transferase, subunit B
MDGRETIFLACCIARVLKGRRHVAVGANLPIPAAAALLARELSGGTMDVSILGSRKFSRFSRLGDLFDFASQGRLDGFFLSPGEIDGQANINMIGVGDYPRLDVRWPGSHGSPLLYMLIPNIILFREAHKKRIFVPKVSFVSAAGTSPPNVYRPGGPSALITNLGQFRFDSSARRFRLQSVHPGHTVEEIEENTGFTFDRAAPLPITPLPEPNMLAALRERVATQVSEIYPQFAAGLRSGAESVVEAARSAPAVTA